MFVVVIINELESNDVLYHFLDLRVLLKNIRTVASFDPNNTRWVVMAVA